MFQQRQNDRPMARREQLAVQRVDDELVVYDSLTHRAHCLAPHAVSVWELADGERTCAEIGYELGRDADFVRQAVEQLRGIQLLEDQGPISISRRDAAKRIAKIGGATMAAPLIYSVMVPSAAAAASCIANGGADPSLSNCKGTDPKCCSGSCRKATGNNTICCADTGSSCTTGAQCCSQTCANTGVCT